MSANDNYQTPLASRYASLEMRELFSVRKRTSTWRQLWLWLAEAQKELGIPISGEAIDQMKAHIVVTDEDLKVAAVEEKKRRHDVMAHVHTFGLVAPAAAGIIHLAATSCFVTDNADLLFLRDGLDLILPKLATVISKLSDFAIEYKDMPTLGYTHLQPAQLITVGRRGASWVQDLMMDLADIEKVREDLRFRGAQGTTGTQAERYSAEKIGLQEMLLNINPNIYDLRVANVLSAFGATVQKICSDIRHLAAQKEMEEPFERDQIGSSAMAYKRNPMRYERVCSLGRHLANLNKDCSDTFANQWFERTLDDSAIRRIDLPHLFLCSDSILMTLDNIFSGLVVYPAVIHAHVMAELPFMATENIIMKLVTKGGGNRQQAHEEIRVLSHQASDNVKKEGKPNNLVELIKNNSYFDPVKDEIDQMLDPMNFIGRCPELVTRYCQDPEGEVQTALKPYKKYIDTSKAVELSV